MQKGMSKTCLPLLFLSWGYSLHVSPSALAGVGNVHAFTPCKVYRVYGGLNAPLRVINSI